MANLTGAYLHGAKLTRADLFAAELPRARLRLANLTWANLREAYLSRADLSWTDLAGANLREANLSMANLRGADLTWANMSMANLAGADFTRANLTGIDLRGAILDDVLGYINELKDQPIEKGHRHRGTVILEEGFTRCLANPGYRPSPGLCMPSEGLKGYSGARPSCCIMDM